MKNPINRLFISSYPSFFHLCFPWQFTCWFHYTALLQRLKVLGMVPSGGKMKIKCEHREYIGWLITLYVISDRKLFINSDNYINLKFM